MLQPPPGQATSAAGSDIESQYVVLTPEENEREPSEGERLTEEPATSESETQEPLSQEEVQSEAPSQQSGTDSFADEYDAMADDVADVAIDGEENWDHPTGVSQVIDRTPRRTILSSHAFHPPPHARQGERNRQTQDGNAAHVQEKYGGLPDKFSGHQQSRPMGRGSFSNAGGGYQQLPRSYETSSSDQHRSGGYTSHGSSGWQQRGGQNFSHQSRDNQGGQSWSNSRGKRDDSFRGQQQRNEVEDSYSGPRGSEDNLGGHRGTDDRCKGQRWSDDNRGGQRRSEGNARGQQGQRRSEGSNRGQQRGPGCVGDGFRGQQSGQERQELAGDGRYGSVPLATINEIDGDLFKAPEEISLAHCVAADFRMGSGIAVTFRQKFGSQDVLLNQYKGVGDCAMLKVKARHVFYLVTKKLSSGKPTMQSLRSSVEVMRQQCVDNGVTKLAMPRIGCGLDRLNWTHVRRMLEEVFAGAGVDITVYNFPQADDASTSDPPKKRGNLFILNHRMNLAAIDSQTGLVYFCSEDGAETPTLKSLDERHHLLPRYRQAPKACGEVVSIRCGKEFTYGLVVRKAAKDPISYVHLASCLKKLRRINDDDYLGFYGIEAFRDGGDELTTDKIVTCFRSMFGFVKYKLEVWVCWPKDMEGDHEWEEAKRGGE